MVSNHLRGKQLPAQFAVFMEKPFAFPATGFRESSWCFDVGMREEQLGSDKC